MSEEINTAHCKEKENEPTADRDEVDLDAELIRF